MINTRTMSCTNTPTPARQATITAGHPLHPDFAEALTTSPRKTGSIIQAALTLTHLQHRTTPSR